MSSHTRLVSQWHLPTLMVNVIFRGHPPQVPREGRQGRGRAGGGANGSHQGLPTPPLAVPAGDAVSPDWSTHWLGQALPADWLLSSAPGSDWDPNHHHRRWGQRGARGQGAGDTSLHPQGRAPALPAPVGFALQGQGPQNKRRVREKSRPTSSGPRCQGSLGTGRQPQRCRQEARGYRKGMDTKGTEGTTRQRAAVLSEPSCRSLRC